MAGCRKKISESGGALPQVSSTLDGREVAFLADYITQDVIDGEIVTTPKTAKIRGSLQPLKAEEVELKPEGQRSWSWEQIHVKAKYPELRVNQTFEIGGTPYRLKAMKDFSRYGYREYHVIKDFGNDS